MFRIEGMKIRGNEFAKTYEANEYNIAKFEYECLCLVSQYVVLAEIKGGEYKQLKIYYK